MKPVFPAKLRRGDRIRYVSPASPPDRDAILRRVERLEALGFEVDIGRSAFAEHGIYAGRHEDRLADINEALADPKVRAIFATRGGRGSYRIADQLDFAAVLRDPKPFLGFSDITAIHMMLMRQCGLVGFHGALFGDGQGASEPENLDILLKILTQGGGQLEFSTREGEASARLTTSGQARGRLIGGNMDILATMTGWGLPDLDGAILLIEAVDCAPGLTDRMLTLLRKSGCLDGIVGVVVGQFTLPSPDKADRILTIVKEHLDLLGVPVLGGLPFGHGAHPLTVPLGTMAWLDADAGRLTVSY